MAFGITPGEIIDYVLESDRDYEIDDPRRTVFHYRTFSRIERKNLEDQQGSMEIGDNSNSVQMRLGTSNYLALLGGLTGWDHYHLAPTKDGQLVGEPIPFVQEVTPRPVLGTKISPPTADTLDALDADDARELGNAIREGLRLSRDEVKA